MRIEYEYLGGILIILMQQGSIKRHTELNAKFISYDVVYNSSIWLLVLILEDMCMIQQQDS